MGTHPMEKVEVDWFVFFIIFYELAVGEIRLWNLA
jgi:hypothetical protein